VTTGKLGIVEALDAPTASGCGTGTVRRTCAAIDPRPARRLSTSPPIPQYRPDHRQLPGRSGWTRLAGHAYNPQTGILYMRSTSIAPTRRRHRSTLARPIRAAAAPCSPAPRCLTATAISARRTPSSSRPFAGVVPPTARAHIRVRAADRRRLVFSVIDRYINGLRRTDRRCCGRSGTTNTRPPPVGSTALVLARAVVGPHLRTVGELDGRRRARYCRRC